MSCPGDVEKYLKNVQNAINKYNNEIGMKSTHIIFNLNYWKTDTFPDIGSEPQEVVNKQLTSKCEHCIAVFGTRLGSATKHNVSGTIEEIKLIKKNGGAGMVFFAKSAEDIDKINPEELKKLQEFKNNFKGLRDEFVDEIDLENKLFKKLKLFAESLKEKATLSKWKNNSLQLKSFLKGKICNNLLFEKIDMSVINVKMKQLENAINAKFNKVNSIHLQKEDLSESVEDFKKNCHAKKVSKTLRKAELFCFDDQDKSVVNGFVKAHNIELSNDFCDFGNAKFVSYYFDGVGMEVEGTIKEKLKADSAWDMVLEIDEYNSLAYFKNQIENKYFLTLVLDNQTNQFCNDIEIGLVFDSINFVNPFTLHYKNEKMTEFLNSYISDLLMPFSDFDIEPMLNNSYDKNNTENFEEHNEYLNNILNKLYPFKYKFENDKIYLKFNIQNLQQSNSRFICGKLIFNSPINKINYSIVTKSICGKTQSTITSDPKICKNFKSDNKHN